MKYEVMPAFWAAVNELRNPVRRDLVKVLALDPVRGGQPDRGADGAR